MRTALTLLASVASVRAAETAFSPSWAPPKCASWCHWEPSTSCLVVQCKDCDFCEAPAPEQPQPQCADWCDATKHCADSRCSRCYSCTAESGETAKCMAFCGLHHCKAHDSRCMGCELCGAPPPKPTAASSQCPQWCSATQNGHCGFDDRCDGCAFCHSTQGAAAARQPAPTLPAAQAGGAAVGDASCAAIGPRLEVHRPTSRVSVVVSQWVDDGTISLDFRGTQMELSFLEDGAHNHRWEPVAPPMLGPTDGVLAYRMLPTPKGGGGAPIEKLALTILSEEEAAWEEPRVSCSSTRTPWPPKPPPPPRPPRPPPLAQRGRVPSATPPPAAEAPRRAPLLEVRAVSCESATLAWADAAPPRTRLEYELEVRERGAAAPLGTISTGAHEHTVEHLAAATPLEFRVRARDPARPLDGWGPQGVATASTSALDEQMAAPDAPSLAAAAEACGAIQLLLPELRTDCARESSLVLEYRVAGEEAWAAYSQQGLRSTRLQVKVADASVGYEFRLVARRAEKSSAPSASLGPVSACGELLPPVRAAWVRVAVPAALLLAASLCVACVGCCVCRGGARRPAGHRPVRRQSDEEGASTLGCDDEVTVHYDIDGAVQSGILPLEGVGSIAQLLEEVADFGAELIGGAEIHVEDIDVHYEEAHGKMKKITARTPLSVVLVAGSLSVSEKKGRFRQKGARGKR
ncbi:hypothetical protein AB1Y20_010604 [Prymnesium parvum]|uniref:Fibronectin type-III domain-containing protein n=1 Tax=Prymnesium parvum TaxID=97485 RepID=A0AB34IQ79_PRYPA